MKGSFKKTMLFALITLTLVVSALGVTPAFADDNPPPPANEASAGQPADESAVEEPAAAEEAAAEESAPAAVEPVEAESPAATEESAGTEEEVTPAEVLEQLPEDTQLVVLDESGEALPLATEEAAEVLAAPDPYFTVGSVLYQFSAADCDPDTAGNQACSTPIQAAINYLANLDATPDDNTIYVEAGTYTENIEIDGSRWNSLGDLYLQGAGSGSTTVNGYLNAVNLNNAFGLSGFTFNDYIYVQTASDVTLKDVESEQSSRTAAYVRADGDISISNSTFENSSLSGLLASSYSGKITLDGVTISNNSDYGAYVYTKGSNGDINIRNSIFTSNNSGGLYADTYDGNITLDGVTASGDHTTVGARVDTYGAGDIQVFDSTFGDNAGYGLYAYSSSGSITLNGVTANENGGGEGSGAWVKASGDVQILNSTFNNNVGDGLSVYSLWGNIALDNVTASGNSYTGAYATASGGSVEVNCGEFSSNDWGLLASTPDLYLNGANFSGNTGGDYANIRKFGGNISTGTCTPVTNSTPVTSGGGSEKKPVQYVIISRTQEQLPGALDDGLTFGSALKVEVIGEANDAQNPTFTLSFPIPADMQDAELVVMFWNGSAWVEVLGGSVVDGNFIIDVSQLGMYALVSK